MTNIPNSPVSAMDLCVSAWETERSRWERATSNLTFCCWACAWMNGWLSHNSMMVVVCDGTLPLAACAFRHAKPTFASSALLAHGKELVLLTHNTIHHHMSAHHCRFRKGMRSRDGWLVGRGRRWSFGRALEGTHGRRAIGGGEGVWWCPLSPVWMSFAVS